tara:strand:- start:52227 stop:52697 length:471 start_codon:yes stop_codon:yes gene_type:complete
MRGYFYVLYLFSKYLMALSVTIQEEFILNGNDRSNTHTKTYTVTQLHHRTYDITTAESSVLLFGSANAAGTLKNGDLQYLRITNLDNSATVTLRIRDTAQEYFVKLNAGGSYILTEDQLDADATGAEESVSLAQITKISAVASSGTVALEVYAAAT